MSYELKGTLYSKTETQQKTETFKVREFVVEVVENYSGKDYTNYIKFQCSQERTSLLDNVKKGDNVTVNFNLKGSKVEKDGKTYFFNNLDAWKIESAPKDKNRAISDAEVVDDNWEPGDGDSLPF